MNTMKVVSPLVSIIIPIHNVDQYVHRCIKSAVNQSYKELEILLVDDGSSDQSCELCQGYGNKDDRIVLVSQRNSGVSNARNTGLDIMTGDYVAFLDSDDYLHPDAIQTLIANMVPANADICIGSFKRVAELEERYSELQQNVPKRLAVMDVWRELFGDEHLKYGPVWGSLFRSSLFNSIRFPNDQTYEDVYIIQDLYGLSDGIISINSELYYYTMRDGSITRNWTAPRMVDSLLATANRYCFFYEKGIQELIEKSAELHLNHAIYCFGLAEGRALKSVMLEMYNLVWESYESIALRKRADYKAFAYSPHLYYVYRMMKDKVGSLMNQSKGVISSCDRN